MENLFRLELSDQPLQVHYQIGLVITTYNRPHYLRRCLMALRRSILHEVIILIVDDGSNNEETSEFIHSFSIPDVPVLKAFRIQKNGCRMYESLSYGWGLLHNNFNCTYLCNLDADTIVKKHWLAELRNIYESERQKKGPFIITGFNATSHPVISHAEKYYIKKSMGGINLFFDQQIYSEIVLSRLTDIYWDWNVVKAMKDHKYPLLCTRPSVIQHIGKEGLWSNPCIGHDIAVDYRGTNPFIMLSLRVYYFSNSLFLLSKFYLKTIGRFILKLPGN
jgi:glycosyltransferase involved in cell wall biosynthesis